MSVTCAKIRANTTDRPNGSRLTRDTKQLERYKDSRITAHSHIAVKVDLVAPRSRTTLCLHWVSWRLMSCCEIYILMYSLDTIPCSVSVFSTVH